MRQEHFLLPHGSSCYSSGMFPRFLCLLCVLHSASAAADRPNVLWLTSEDNGPQLGCYGDPFATTPHLDKLAARSIRYLHAWSVAPVCAPARTTIISGLYPSSTGSEHMRSRVSLPPQFQLLPQYLREAGYYCTNNAKEDYNLEKPGRIWDESSRKAHWQNRAPNQPFFAVFNFEQTHESQCRKRPHTFVHDPAKVSVPAFHPDCREVRESWAQYHDQMTVMDGKIGEVLAQLETEGLAQDTVVFYFGDHGPGLPRCKRTPCNSGLQVPLLVHFPDKWRRLAPKDCQPGGTSDRLVSFVDLAPTLLSICGVRPPGHFQGLAFAGEFTAPPREFNYGLRGRMDERCDLVRSVTDGRFVYLRNYMPHRPWGQHNAYLFETPMTVAWQKLFQQGKLSPELAAFWLPKAPEELYDLQEDPAEIRNLAASPRHRKTLERLRKANREQLLKIRDVDLLPEAEMLARAQNSTPWDLGHDDLKYPVDRILRQAEAASMLDGESTDALLLGLADADSAVRYWSVLGLLMRGEKAVSLGAEELMKLLRDPCPSVRIAAAETMAKAGPSEHREAAIALLLTAANVAENPYYAAVAALNAIDELDAKIAGHLAEIQALPRRAPHREPRTGDYPERLLAKILADLNP